MQVLTVLAITLFSTTTPVVGGGEKEEIQAEIKKLESKLDSAVAQEAALAKKARVKELEVYMREFKVDGLKLGDPEHKHRCCCEEYGVYLGSRYIADIHSLDSDQKLFSRQSFLKAVRSVLMSNGLVTPDFDLGQNEIEFVIHPSTDSLLKSWGGGVSDREMDYGNPEEKLGFDLNTKRVESAAVGGVVVVVLINRDGSREIAIIAKGRVIAMQNLPVE